jgi:ketosteroid isomerase-like protein
MQARLPLSWQSGDAPRSRGNDYLLHLPLWRRTATTLFAMIAPDVLAMKKVVVGSADDEIVGCEAEIRAAQLNADVTALERLIADELLFTGPDGQLGSKAEDLALHSSGAVRFRSHEPEELRVRRVGSDVAVASLRARLEVEVEGKSISGTYRYTRVWARENGSSWRVVGGHVSQVQ